jgi:N-acetyl-anhydromuramyl-L-alanine amidase AmpD
MTRLTPNRRIGGLKKVAGIVLHHTAGSFDGSVSWCMKAESKVSYHAIVALDGRVVQLANDNDVCFHAGQSEWRGRRLCNGFMLGVAVSGDTTRRVLGALEVAAVAKWCVERMKRHGLTIADITTHREISPGRKADVDTRAEEAIKKEIERQWK